MTAISWLNDTCAGEESTKNGELLDDQRTLSGISDCEGSNGISHLTTATHCTSNRSFTFYTSAVRVKLALLRLAAIFFRCFASNKFIAPQH